MHPIPTLTTFLKKKDQKNPFPNYKGGNIGKIGITTSLGSNFKGVFFTKFLKLYDI